MQEFLITYAPPLVVALSIIVVFVWGANSRFLEDNE